MQRLKTIEWAEDSAKIVDQTCLPTNLVFENITTVEKMVEAIKKLKIRGAPAIGIAAAFGVYLAMRNFPDSGSLSDFTTLCEKNMDYLAQSRPTAVNLFWALERMRKFVFAHAKTDTVEQVKNAILSEAKLMLDEDNQACRAIGEHGFELLKGCSTLLTHCNAGGLATAEYGTALAPMYVGKEKGKLFHVYSDETRPLLQGSRITAFELAAAGIPVTVICDNMAATVMKQGKIDAVIVGADRITANGDTANKIGTYGVALLAKAHKIPFYVAAPTSTFDAKLATGDEIPIEERDADEIKMGFGKQTAPSNVSFYNPAFDVTPNNLISAFITENGVLMPPFAEKIKNIKL